MTRCQRIATGRRYKIINLLSPSGPFRSVSWSGRTLTAFKRLSHLAACSISTLWRLAVYLASLPIASCGLKLDDNAVRVTVSLRLGLELRAPHECHCGSVVEVHLCRDPGRIAIYRVAQKTGPPSILSHFKYSENSVTELRGNWWTSAILYAEHSH